ncbi:MAG: 3D domain-containing protein [Lentisphaeria bacterium]|nr:3D domain-containing protein [Lentisphaeria bacterium]
MVSPTLESREWTVFFRRCVLVLMPAGLTVFLNGCAGTDGGGRPVRMEVTAYCSCGTCCGWRRTWLGKPVHVSGPRKGERKEVGVCADGSRAKKGVAAADTAYYPFGTRLHVPGYGDVVVRDRGRDIKGPRRLDVFFPRHGDAVKWGRQTVTVMVYE